MTHFEYVTVLMSIVLALAISEVLSGWGRLIRERHRVRPDLLHLVWSVLVLLMLLQLWWGTWQYRHLTFERFGALLLLVAPSLAMVLATFVLMPHGERALDLRRHYLESRRWFFGIAAVSIVLLILVDAFVGHQPVVHPENAIRLAAIGVLLVLARSERIALHWAAAGVCVALLVLFLAFAFRAA